MKKTLSSQEVIKQYIETGLVLRVTTLNGDYKRGNKEGKKVMKVFEILKKDVELAENSLPLLFSDENVVTRTKAAAHCLKLNIRIVEAEKVLEKAASDETNGIFGFNAQMTLKVWRGEFPGKTL